MRSFPLRFVFTESFDSWWITAASANRVLGKSHPVARAPSAHFERKSPAPAQTVRNGCEGTNLTRSERIARGWRDKKFEFGTGLSIGGKNRALGAGDVRLFPARSTDGKAGDPAGVRPVMESGLDDLDRRTPGRARLWRGRGGGESSASRTGRPASRLPTRRRAPKRGRGNV